MLDGASKLATGPESCTIPFCFGDCQRWDEGAGWCGVTCHLCVCMSVFLFSLLLICHGGGVVVREGRQAGRQACRYADSEEEGKKTTREWRPSSWNVSHCYCCVTTT